MTSKGEIQRIRVVRDVILDRDLRLFKWEQFDLSSLSDSNEQLMAALLWLMLHFQSDATLPYWLPGEPQHVEMIGVLAVLVLVRHHANFRRLISRREPRIGDDAR